MLNIFIAVFFATTSKDQKKLMVQTSAFALRRYQHNWDYPAHRCARVIWHAGLELIFRPRNSVRRRAA